MSFAESQPLRRASGPPWTRAIAAALVAGAFLPGVAGAGMAVRSGTYSGNGTDNRAIFVGIQPDVVFVKRDAASNAVVRTSTMTGDRSKSLDTAGVALAANRIQSLEPTGFTVGTDALVNASGTTYYWVAFEAAAGELKVGTYVGNAVDDRSITGVGFQPEYVVTLPAAGGAAGVPLHRPSTMAGDTSYDFDSTQLGPPGDAIQALEADGFQVGLHAAVNTSNATYHYIAWNAVAGSMALGTYLGDGTDDRNLDVAGFLPEWVLVKRDGSLTPWLHKPASTGPTTNYSLYFAALGGNADDIQQLRPLGFQVGFGPEALPDRTNEAGVTYHWIAFGPRAATANYRSIGAASPYGTGTISVTSGSTSVTGSGSSWAMANRGRGDVITIPCDDPPFCTLPTPGVHYTVAAVSGSSELQLTQGYAGTTASGVSYLIRRQFSTLAAWEDCIDGLANGGSCAFFPPASDSLVTDKRSEIGIAYDDVAGADLAGGVVIDGNVVANTDATHTITLTADGGNRNYGRTGLGVVIDNGANLASAIQVSDDFVTIEWMEITGGGAGADGIALGGIGPTSQVVLRNNLIHGVNADGLDIADDDSKADVYDNIIYGNAGRGVRVSPGILQPGSRYRLLNNTVYGNGQEGFFKTPGASAAATILLRNNIAHTNGGGDYALDPADSIDSQSSNNLGGDATGGVAHSPAGGNLDSVPLASLRFVSTTPASENLHIQEGSAAENNGVDLSGVFTNDIDDAQRRVTWDRGADDVPPVANCRSIGIAPNYGTGAPPALGGGTTVTVTDGSPVVTGSAGVAWRTANRGRGDRITINGVNYVVAGVGAENSLRLTQPHVGGGAGLSYTIARQFTTLSAWENCVDGGAGTCAPFPDVTTSLVNDDRSEVGIAYKDGPLARVDIIGSTTDALHTITLTADPGNRHLGIPGNGVVVNGTSVATVLVEDENVTVEWLEIQGGADEGIEFQNLSPGNKLVVRNMLIHDVTLQGILIDDANANVEAYNNIVYDSSDAGNGTGIRVGLVLTTGTARISNNTVYSNLAGGITASGSNPSITLTNNIAHSNTGSGDYSVTALNSSSRNNLAGNASGTTHSPAGGGLNSVPLSGAGGVNFVDTETVITPQLDLHLQGTSFAIDKGVALGGVFATDIDAGIRTGTWDLGADEFGATTEVRLLSFDAVPGDGSVTLEWRTGSELQNLGFHLHRGPSASGPWTRLTSSLIPGLGSSPVGQSYSWLDGGLANGVTYFYRLEDVDTSSVSTYHGPVSATPQAAAPLPGGGSGGAGGGSSGETGSTGTACPAWVLAALGESSSASTTCTKHGEPDAVSLGVVSRDARGATLELRTGGFWALHEPSGTIRVFVPGFDTPGDPSAPALPVRRALVDAEVGKGVRLVSAEALELVGFDGLRPSAAGALEMAVSWDGTLRPARRAVAAPRLSRGYLPSRVARLLGTVFQGETKSAVLELTPVRFDGGRQRLVLARRVRVRLAFTGQEAGETGAASRGRRQPRRRTSSGEVLAQLHTARRGLHAVSFEELFPARQRGLPTLQLRLQRQGQAISFRVEPVTGAFGPGSTLYFLAGETARSTDYTSEVAFELVRSTAGHSTAGQTMEEVAGTPESAASPSSSPLGLASFETNRIYQPGLLEAPDVWLWEGVVSEAMRTVSFPLSGLDPGSPQPAQLSVFLQGGSEAGLGDDHHVQASLNGVVVGEGRFAGKKAFVLRLSVPASLLQDGTNRLDLLNVGDTGVRSVVFLDKVRVVYPRLPRAQGGVFEGSWTEGGTVEVSGLAGAPVVVDLTLEKWLAGFETAPGAVRFRAEAGHTYLVVSWEGLLSPRIARPQASTLRDLANQADYVLVAPREFLAAARPLLARREGQGLTTMGVAFEEVAEVFGHGQPSAEAIREFLSYAFHRWSRPSPRYVLLLGDATSDPRRFLATSWASPLPALWARTSYLWTASDPALGAVNGTDLLPDVSIGRLPATSVAEAERLVSKVLAWEDSGQGLSGGVVLVADDPDGAGDFEWDVLDIQQSFLAGRPTQVLKLSELQGATRAAILDAFNGGASLVSYVGHGGAAVWASENVWNSWDVRSLLAQSQQPVLLTPTCLNGYFVAPTFDALGEALLKAEGRGVIAAFSPSGLSLDGPAHVYHRALVAELVSGRHERLGDAVLAAQRVYAQAGVAPELLSVYNLLGDPATRIR